MKAVAMWAEAVLFGLLAIGYALFDVPIGHIAFAGALAYIAILSAFAATADRLIKLQRDLIERLTS